MPMVWVSSMTLRKLKTSIENTVVFEFSNGLHDLSLGRGLMTTGCDHNWGLLL